VDTFLTLVIALGGIATGIGAIWTAVLARRQLDEQRRFLVEQTEIARRQAQVSERQAQATEQSLAQTERSIGEQNERARLTFEVDMISRMEERFDSPEFASRRRRAARYILDNAFEDGDDTGKVRRLNRSGWDVCNFFERLGELQKTGALGTEPLWSRFGLVAGVYWALCEPAIENLRETWGDPSYFEAFERLIRVGADLDREQGVGDLPQEQLRRLMEHETVVGEEATGGEEPIAP
jgi:hypothetical protein